jgi:iron(III) transport system permease protein
MSHPATTARPGAGRHPRTRLAPPSAWTVAAVAVALVVAMPIFAVVASLAAPRLHVWGHLLRTQMGELVANTVLLLVGVGAGVLVLGTFLAWLVATYQFPGRAVFEWALMLPLAMPAYVIGFVFLGLFDFAGPVQTALRELFGPGVRLPNLRSGWGVILMMTLVFYPYVYTLARMAFLEQAPGTLESARSLGYSRFQAFLRVTLPMARPSLVAGVSLALMEALADFGTVATFGYRTFTEAIYRVWHGMFDRIAATQLAVVLLGFAFMVLLLERASRGRARFTQGRGRGRSLTPTALTGFRAWAASGACLTVLLLAFGLPVGQLAVWAFSTLTRQGPPADFGRQLENSLWLAGISAAAACVLAVVLAYALRLHPTPGVTLSTRFAAMGYALPGAVIAVGVLLPMAWLDHTLADTLREIFGVDVGLVLTGSAAGLVFAYLVRFLAVSFQTVEASLSKIPKNLDEAARSLGAGAGGTLRQVHLPLIHRGLLAALALVFVDVMKEMPATLLLRPFGLNTLAVGVWQFTAESLWEEAALPALAIVAAGLVPVAMAMRWISPDGQETEQGRR